MLPMEADSFPAVSVSSMTSGGVEEKSETLKSGKLKSKSAEAESEMPSTVCTV
jgi:hypothetical protein